MYRQKRVYLRLFFSLSSIGAAKFHLFIDSNVIIYALNKVSN